MLVTENPDIIVDRRRRLFRAKLGAVPKVPRLDLRSGTCVLYPLPELLRTTVRS